MQSVNITLLLFLLCSCTDSARILGVFQLSAVSHFRMFEPILKELAARGHQVHVVSHHPQKTRLPNYKDISVEGVMPSMRNNITTEVALDYSSQISSLYFFWFYNLDSCKAVFEHPDVQRLIHSDESYDLVITEMFGVDCALAFGHKFRAPTVNLLTGTPFPWSHDRVGNPNNPAYIKNYFMHYSTPLTFFDRLCNTLFSEGSRIAAYFLSDLRTHRLTRQYFGDDLPSMWELQKNVSLILVNSHFTLSQPKPLVPAMIEVAGLHLKPAGKLPQDIQKFLDDSPQGVIYFSLGSLIRAETFPEEILRSFMEVFQELPQRVLWKYDGELTPGLSAKIKTQKWMPQTEILSHPNVRVFITHGGNMGTQEAIHYGVPMIAIPFFGDQLHNAMNFKDRGIAEVLDPRSMTKDDIRHAMKTVLEQPSYRENARRLSELFRDRPQKPLDTAVYWIEYVIRHRGAPHLQTAAVDMPLYQYLLLDVIACLLIAWLILLGIVWLIARKIFSLLCGKKQVQKVGKVKTSKVKKKQ